MDQMKRASLLLALDGVSGGYSINRPVIHDLTFHVKQGDMVALLGLNGAGKSTTMKHILGLLKPHNGTIQIAGKVTEGSEGSSENELAGELSGPGITVKTSGNIPGQTAGQMTGERKSSPRTSIAYVPETPLLYDELTVYEHLELSARAYGLSQDIFRKRSDRLLETFRMTNARDQLSIHLSKGMRQKVMIMCAFLVEPLLYVIDEPFIGLDPLAIRAVLEMMEEKKREGAGLLISSHILSMIEKYADRFVILHEGKLVVDGGIEAVRKTAGTPGASLEDAFYRIVKGGDET